MKFIPVIKMETRAYDVYVPENVQKVIKAYEKWYDDMSKENETSLINAIKAAEPDFDEKTDDFEGHANEIIYDIRWSIYNREKSNASLDFVILAARLGASLGREFSDNLPLHLFIFRIFRQLPPALSRFTALKH